MSRENNYNEYYKDRRPANFSNNIIYFWHSRMFDFATKYIPKFIEKSILEVGVGFGYFAHKCLDSGVNYYIGLEMNENLAAELSNQGFNVTCSAIPPFPELYKKVDIIWMSHILEHARDYMHAREMLRSAYDKLNLCGYIVVICPDIISWRNYFYDLEWSHGFPTTRIRLNQILSDVGFNIKVSKHHVATITNDFISLFLCLIFRLIPVKFIDWISFKLFKKTYCSSFMTLFGWRQIIIIAQK